MKLLVLENSNQIPRTLQDFLHDNDSQFESVLTALKLKQLPADELLDLFNIADAMAAVTRFQDTDLIEGLAHTFARGLYHYKPFQIHVVGFVHQLNYWTTPIPEEQEQFCREFSNYDGFTQNLKLLARTGKLFNIEEDLTRSHVVDHRPDTDGRLIFYKRRRMVSVPIRYSTEHQVFHTDLVSPDKVLDTISVIQASTVTDVIHNA